MGFLARARDLSGAARRRAGGSGRAGPQGRQALGAPGRRGLRRHHAARRHRAHELGLGDPRRGGEWDRAGHRDGAAGADLRGLRGVDRVPGQAALAGQGSPRCDAEVRECDREGAASPLRWRRDRGHARALARRRGGAQAGREGARSVEAAPGRRQRATTRGPLAPVAGSGRRDPDRRRDPGPAHRRSGDRGDAGRALRRDRRRGEAGIAVRLHDSVGSSSGSPAGAWDRRPRLQPRHGRGGAAEGRHLRRHGLSERQQEVGVPVPRSVDQAARVERAGALAGHDRREVLVRV